MKSKGKSIALIVCVLLLLLAAMPTVLADAGNFNDFDFDFGGGGSSSTGSGLMGLLFMLGGGDHTISSVGVAILILILVTVLRNRRNGGRKTGGDAESHNSSEPVVVDYSDLIASTIIRIDPNFSKERFIGWAKEVYLTIQDAWMERDWSRIRPFEKEELFRQHEMQLQEYIDKGRINVMERINIVQAYLNKYEQDAEYEYLTVFMQVRMVDYIIDEKTKKVLMGDKNRDSHLKYLMTFTRKKGVLTEPGKSNNSVVACPHCGAPTEITSAGKCEYCGYIVTTGEYDWVLCDMQGVKPGVSVDNRGIILHSN